MGSETDLIRLESIHDKSEPDDHLLPPESVYDKSEPDDPLLPAESIHESESSDPSVPPTRRAQLLAFIHSRFPHDFSIKDSLCQLPSLVLSVFRGLLYAFVPQLIRTICFHDPAPEPKIHSTSWMNGLRGIASFFVFNEHFFYMFTYTIVVGIGYSPKDVYIHQVPVFELFTDGIASVVVFFTVAGYVCSYKTVQAMTTGKHEGLFKSLSLSVFRRWFRLYLPVFCSTLCISMLLYAGVFEPTRHYFDLKVKPQTFPGPGSELPPPRFPTLWLQLGYWWSTFLQICNFWTERPVDPMIDVHLWTIVHEYRGSIQLYILLVALGWCRSWIRAVVLGLVGYVFVIKFAHWESSCFFFAAIIAQLDVMRQQKQDALPGSAQGFKFSWPSCVSFVSRRTFKTCLRTFGYCVALYLLSFPMRGTKYPSPLYQYTVNPLIPAAYGRSAGPKFPKQVGVLMLLSLLTTTPIEQRAKSIWHRMLTCQITTYLGSIMFGFYLVHGMILRSFGYFIPHLVWRAIGGDDTMMKHLFGLFVGYTTSLIAALWAGDVWTREVEGRCMAFTRWLESLFFEKKS